MTPRDADTVLIIDDDAKVRGAIVSLLSRNGYRVLEAGNGSEAIHLFAEHSHEIIAVTLDLDMPTTNGRETLAMLSAYAPRLPVLVVTGWPIEELPVRIPGTPGVGYLAKPFVPAELVTALRNLTEAIRSPRG